MGILIYLYLLQKFHGWQKRYFFEILTHFNAFDQLENFVHGFNTSVWQRCAIRCLANVSWLFQMQYWALWFPPWTRFDLLIMLALCFQPRVRILFSVGFPGLKTIQGTRLGLIVFLHGQARCKHSWENDYASFHNSVFC